jgi:hypothetical protein
MRGLDGIVAAIAARQHGVVARRQLIAAGIPARWIERRLDQGTLIRVFPGVYRVGHTAPSVEADYMAAVLACGTGSVLSGRAAARLLGLLRAPSAPEVIASTKRQIPRITTSRARAMHPQDATTWMGIPVTSPARTLVDLAAVVSAEELARAVHEAAIKHRTKPADVDEVLARRPNSKGAATLREILHGDQGKLLSQLERAFIRLLRDAGLPLPVTNRLAGGRLVDCRWPDHRLTVELDSYRYHASRHAWELDRKREREAYARGDQFRRYTWGDVFERPAQTIRELQSAVRAAL